MMLLIHDLWPQKNMSSVTEKVLFNIASEASCVYILSGQKFIKNAKNGEFLPETCGLAGLSDMLFLLVENAKMEKLKCDLF